MLTTVFEIRKKIIEAYGQYEYIIIPAQVYGGDCDGDL